MKYLSLLVGAVILLTGCASTKVEVKPEEQIVGVWHLKDYGTGNYEYSQLGFTAGGRKCVVSVSMNGSGFPEIDYYDNTWKINNGVLETTVGDSPSSSLPKGYLIKDHIKVLNQDELVVQMESFGAPLEKHQKLHGVQPERICQLVENYARLIKRNNA
ncbi:lipocalin family protein [Thalassomonas sp. RHCl1]|uniref:lipocalin family protein n=1 Tax=Thalassomonas sp. RHCl1 TaxID=2995320 RepID=UPI00248B9CAD|nr:lipocalin family protein [Thalassomonas sp. RHCl1]